jgi:hypothetical protein
MNVVQAHLSRCAENFRERELNPIVAWDCLGAARWATQCDELAVRVDGLDDVAALAFLKQVRHDVENAEAEQSSWGLFSHIDTIKQLDRIIDPIARDIGGWIEVGSWGGLDDGQISRRPGYRRMLGVNHCVSSCGRERGESETHWLARRDVWLAQYHPDVIVVRARAAWSEGAQYTEIMATAGTFRSIEHVHDTGLAPGMKIKTSDAFILLVVDAGPLPLAMQADFSGRITSGTLGRPGQVIRMEYGRCLLLA